METPSRRQKFRCFYPFQYIHQLQSSVITMYVVSRDPSIFYCVFNMIICYSVDILLFFSFYNLIFGFSAVAKCLRFHIPFHVIFNSINNFRFTRNYHGNVRIFYGINGLFSNFNDKMDCPLSMT